MKNVINDDGTELIPGNDGIDNTYQIILNIKKYLPNFNDYLFILFNHNQTSLPISRNFKHNKKILFWEAGERKNQNFNSIKKDFLCVFTHYHNTIKKDNIYSIPLGYFTNKVNGKVISISERLFDITFVGCLNRNRTPLASILTGKSEEYLAKCVLNSKSLENLNHLLKFKYNNDYFHFTGDFNTGVDKERYSYILRNSKIVLCPRGFVNSETFRIYEAMKFGCVAISEKLPERDYYKNTPIIQIDNWKEGINIARDILKDTQKIKQIGYENKKFYDENYHPTQVAKKLTLTIEKL